MKLSIVSGAAGGTRQLELSGPRLIAAVAAAGVVLFAAGLTLGGLLLGPGAEQRALARLVLEQQGDLQATRGRVEGQIDALAARVGAMNAQLIRLDALGKRLTDLAGLDRGEFDFEQPPPAGGPESSEGESPAGSAAVPELTEVLEALESRIEDRRHQLATLETLLATRELGERMSPGGLPIVGGWISSHFGHRTDPFTGRGAFHSGVDLGGAPGSKVIAVGPGTVSFAGYKSGYGYLVELTHPSGHVTRYGHNSRNLVRVGDSVQKGDSIAVIGSTGRSTGTHVHFEVLKDGKVVNPSQYLR